MPEIVMSTENYRVIKRHVRSRMVFDLLKKQKDELGNVYYTKATLEESFSVFIYELTEIPKQSFVTAEETI